LPFGVQLISRQAFEYLLPSLNALVEDGEMILHLLLNRAELPELTADLA
jgi:hypothetical protein